MTYTAQMHLHLWKPTHTWDNLWARWSYQSEIPADSLYWLCLCCCCCWMLETIIRNHDSKCNSCFRQVFTQVTTDMTVCLMEIILSSNSYENSSWMGHGSCLVVKWVVLWHVSGTCQLMAWSSHSECTPVPPTYLPMFFFFFFVIITFTVGVALLLRLHRPLLSVSYLHHAVFSCCLHISVTWRSRTFFNISKTPWEYYKYFFSFTHNFCKTKHIYRAAILRYNLAETPI